MGKYLKKFENHTQYETYINSSDAILPNVSICTTEGYVHYNPYVETRVVAKYNVTDTSSPTKIGYSKYISGFSEIEIDGVVQTAVTSAYTFDTLGEHTVKYTLADPTNIGSSAFQNCSGLTSIVMPNSVTSIGNKAFYNCSGLTRLNSDVDGVFSLPSGVTSIGQSVFGSCRIITSIDIPDSVTNIGKYAFENCSSLTSIDIPSGVTSIDMGTFWYCTSLTSCTIGSGVTSIGYSAFTNCSSLTSIVVPNSVTSIGGYAFNGCNSLTSIVSNATAAPTISSATFQNVHNDGTLTVPQGSTGYDTWMQNADYYLGLYNWTKVEQ